MSRPDLELPDPHALAAAEVAAALGVDPSRGLDAHEADARRARIGPNLLEPAKRPGLPRMVARAVSEPFVILLAAAGLLAVVLGEVRDGLLVLGGLVPIVGADVVMTDSLGYADVVLPACSHFEHHDLYAAYGQHWLQRAEPVIPPQGEALPNTEIFRRLAARFGFTDPVFTASDAELMDDAVDGDDPRLAGVRPSALPTGRALAMTVGGEDAVLFRNVFPRTPSGKVELASTYLEAKYGARLPSWRRHESSFPLTLVSPASDRRITSTFGGVRGSEGTPPLEIHPDDAAARGLRDGMRARVWNALGEVHLPIRITDEVPRGVVCSLKGAWMRTSANGQTVSALCPGHHADISEGACYNDARVEVAALP